MRNKKLVELLNKNYGVIGKSVGYYLPQSLLRLNNQSGSASVPTSSLYRVFEPEHHIDRDDQVAGDQPAGNRESLRH